MNNKLGRINNHHFGFIAAWNRVFLSVNKVGGKPINAIIYRKYLKKKQNVTEGVTISADPGQSSYKTKI